MIATVDWVNLRASGYSGAAVVNWIPKESILYVNNYSLGWYQVNYNGSIGWVWGTYLTTIPSGTYVTIKNATQLNIRSSPTASSTILGVLKTNQYARVLDYSSNGLWMKISVGNLQGWASISYLSYIT